MLKSLKISLSFLSLITVSTAFADIVSINPRPRMLSMGGAGAATFGNFDSAMMNPAGLSDVTDKRLRFLDFTFEAPWAIDNVSSYFDYKDIADDNSKTQAEKKAALRTFLGDVSREALGTRVNFYPSFTAKNLHIGLLADLYVNSRLRAGGLPSNQVVELGGSAGNAALIVGLSHAFLENKLQVGVTIKPIYKISIMENETQTVSDLVAGLNTGADIETQLFGADKYSHRAFGIGVDLGAKYSLAGLPYIGFLKPAVAMTLQDIGDTRFFTSDPLPESIPQSLSAGLALHPEWKIVKTTFAFDLRNITEKQDVMNKIHMGAEARFLNLIAVRAGLSQMYWTLGLGLDAWIFEMDAYIAAKEAGDKAHIQEQRTIGLRLSFGV